MLVFGTYVLQEAQATKLKDLKKDSTTRLNPKEENKNSHDPQKHSTEAPAK